MSVVFCRHVRRSIEQLRRGASKQVSCLSDSSFMHGICFLLVLADVFPLNCLHLASEAFYSIICQQFILFIAT